MGEKNKAEENMEFQTTEALLGGDEAFASEEAVEEFLSALSIERRALSGNFAKFLEARSASSTEPKTSKALRSAAEQVRQQSAARQLSNSTSARSKKQKSASGNYWTNPSVLLLLGEGASLADPVQRITAKARQLILDYSSADNSIEKINPFALAEFYGIMVVARGDVRDSRTVFRDDKFVIEYNPNRSRPRVRYSICHEIAHTLFPDCAKQIRHRATHEQMKGDDWQLEMLCNVGASELLMPLGSLPEFDERLLTAKKLMDLRKELEVSTEALFLRITRVAELPLIVFSASRKTTRQNYQIDYTRSSRFWAFKIPSGFSLPADSVVKNCTAIGFTDFGRETWLPEMGEFHIECVGIPPHPEETLPRVMGIVRPVDESQITQTNRIKEVIGDATKPYDIGVERIIAHIVNDKTANWGGAFALAVRRKWSLAQTAFQEWASRAGNLSIGNVHFVEVEPGLTIATMIAQKGYGESKTPRIRYNFLKKCLDKLADFAAERDASVHMPRIGSGQAGGNWDVISELVEDALCDREIVVYVYTLPGAKVKKEAQPRLDFFGSGRRG